MIFLVHHLLLFFKSTLTVPKIKDLVNAPQKKYEDIYNILSKDSSASSYGSKVDSGFNSINEVKQETKIEISSMKNELKSFLKKQLNNGNNSGLGPTISTSGGSTRIDTLDALSGSGSGSNINFSSY
jgi:hypothetical protein